MSSALRAIVKNGRLVVDEPTDLPDGTELWLLPTDTDEEVSLDALSAEDRAELLGRISRGLDEADQGNVVPADEVLRRMRESRRQ